MVDPFASVAVEKTMGGGQHQIGCNQRPGAKAPLAQIDAPDRVPAARVIAGFQPLQRAFLRYGGTRQANGQCKQYRT
jgi:hypothetical protein